jgi:hypothetical protein
VFSKVAAVWAQILAQGPGVALTASIPASIRCCRQSALTVLARSLQMDISWLSGGRMSAAVYAVVLLPISIAGLGVRGITLFKSLAL